MHPREHSHHMHTHAWTHTHKRTHRRTTLQRACKAFSRTLPGVTFTATPRGVVGNGPTEHMGVLRRVGGARAESPVDGRDLGVSPAPRASLDRHASLSWAPAGILAFREDRGNPALFPFAETPPITVATIRPSTHQGFPCLDIPHAVSVDRLSLHNHPQSEKAVSPRFPERKAEARWLAPAQPTPEPSTLPWVQQSDCQGLSPPRPCLPKQGTQSAQDPPRPGQAASLRSSLNPERVKEGPGLPPVPSEAPSISQRPLLLAQHCRGRRCWRRPANQVNEGLSSQGKQLRENSEAVGWDVCGEEARRRQKPEVEEGTCEGGPLEQKEGEERKGQV